MKTLRSLGNSGMMVTPIGLGCWQFSKQNNLAGKFWPTLEDDLIIKVVALSLEGGINWFDTAEIYGTGPLPLSPCGTGTSGIRRKNARLTSAAA